MISAYAVVSGGFLLLDGRAADLLGRRRIFVSGLALYAGASLAGGLAPAPAFLLVARAVQGLAGALVFPAILSLVNTTFAEGRPPNRGGLGCCRRSRSGGRRAARRRPHPGARLASGPTTHRGRRIVGRGQAGRPPVGDTLVGVGPSMRVGPRVSEVPDPDLDDSGRAYYGDPCLRTIKGEYDPDNVFRFEQSLPIR